MLDRQAHPRSLPSNALLLSKRPVPCHGRDAIRPRDTRRRAPVPQEPILQYVLPLAQFVFRPFHSMAGHRPPAPQNDTRASVSTNRGLSAESLRASLNLLIAAFRLWSKSTNVSAGHSLRCISSREMTSPGRSSNIVNTWKGCSWSFTFTPLRRSSPV